MNWEQLKTSVDRRVQLQPTACRLDENGRELGPIDDDWVIDEVTSNGLRISNPRTGHVTTLVKDHVHDFRTNPDRSEGEFQYRFLTLNVQVYLQGNKLWVRPNSRPGQPVSPSGASPEERTLRARLLNERFKMVDRRLQKGAAAHDKTSALPHKCRRFVSSTDCRDPGLANC